MPIVNYSTKATQRRQVLLCMIGESTSGKTYSALLLGWGMAKGLAKIKADKKIVPPFLQDTENGRGAMYLDDDIVGGYAYGELTPPFAPERFIEGTQDAVVAGAEVLITDTFSHEWEGLGGIIDIADSATTKSGDDLSGLVKWAKPKARHKKLMHYLGRSNLHYILSLRAKDDVEQIEEIQPNGFKKKTIVNKGKKSVQEKRFKFEMTVQLVMEDGKDREGYYTVTKCPKNLRHIFKDGQRITMQTGELLAEWVNGRKGFDETTERLRFAGEKAADGGKDAFVKWWNQKDIKPHWEKLKPFTENFASIAKAADDEAVVAKTAADTAAKTQTQSARNKAAPFDPANPEIK